MVKKVVLIILGILTIFIVTLFAIGYFYPIEEEKEIATPPAPLPPKMRAGAGAKVESGISQLCAEYKNFEDTVSCEQAAALVLTKYQGRIFSIEKTQIDLPLPPGQEKTSELIDVWAISVNLEESADRLKVMVDTTSGEIKILKQI